MARKPVPKYRRQKGKTGDRAFVELGGVRRYLGVYDSPESREEYGRLIAEWEAGGRHLPAPPGEITISELAARYWTFAEGYYVKDGKPTSEHWWIRLALRPLLALYGSSPCADYGPLKLKTVRARMIATGVTRKSINGRIGRIRRMFRWGTENELVPAGVYEALRAVTGLREGRSGAREAEPVKAVPDAHVEAVLPFVSAPVRGLILLQKLSGMRPGEARIMRSIDVDTTGTLWEYRPASHKTQHHGHDRVIMLGPRAQAILREFLADRAVDAFLFSPQDVPRGTGAFYTKDAYIRAVARGCKRAGIPAWRPNQLRHLSGTEIRKVAGLEGSQAWLGHKSARVSEIYAESNQGLARELATRYG